MYLLRHLNQEFYRENIEKPFLRKHLNTPGSPQAAVPDFPAAIVFEVGANQWRQFDEWPPAAAVSRSLHFHPGGQSA